MAVLGGMQVFPSRAFQKQAWDEGRITQQDLEQALAQWAPRLPTSLTVSACLAALDDTEQIRRLPLLVDTLDSHPRRGSRLSWRQAITHQVSQTCAAYFDQQQADWQPERTTGLYQFWRDTLMHDHGIGVLMGLPHLARGIAALPATSEDAERWVLQRLGLPEAVWADYLESVLLTVNGWASWCAYLGWEARLQGRSDDHLRELLAIRLAWGAILVECGEAPANAGAFASLQSAWSDANRLLVDAEHALAVDEVWQLALEVGYQRGLAQQLLRANPQMAFNRQVHVQAAFCIDVRSEPLRRALEAHSPCIQTLGFAGFFGLPIAYTPLGTEARRPQLPGLLAPILEATDRIVSAAPGVGDTDAALNRAAIRSRQERLGFAAQWRAASRWPGSAFSFVEAAGVVYLGKLAGWLYPDRSERQRDDLTGLSGRYRRLARPQISGLDLGGQVALASRVLHAMGLDRALAPLVVLVGHGSQSKNNAHAAALDCGACCGQTGEVNARSLAQLLNDATVRRGLEAQGIAIPAVTRFVAALHNTTTDEIEGFDLDLLTPEARAGWDNFLPTLLAAGAQVRRERAPALHLDPDSTDSVLLDLLRRRANDGAQTRPEWGLAGNAALVIAPRARTLGVSLQGRAFLHDYDSAVDTDGSVLELLMTAPMLVAHWINWQYHASTCEPKQLGSGNKTLHNVVGGNLGVFEGNGGDLRIGLSRQSIHDGTRWMHEPVRLTVVIDAAEEAIDRVIGKHLVLQQLLHNHWLHLWRFEKASLQRYHAGRWVAL